MLKNILENLKVFYYLLQPVSGDTHEDRLENFYHKQSPYYDISRKNLLKGREELFTYMSKYEGEGNIWIDMGGGTGANFDCVEQSLSKFKKIYIVDLSSSLLEVANQRISKNNWLNFEVIKTDVSQFIPPEGSVDIITFSYSLSMMPNWFKIIDHAQKLLKPGGLIGIVDFYVSSKYPAPNFKKHSWLTRTFWTTWFAVDNVFLSPDHLAYLHHNFENINCTEDMATLSFPPGFKAPYYLFIGRRSISG